MDLTTLITNLQADVNAADSDTSMKDILALLHRGSKITEFHKWYDSVGVLPIDSAYGGYMAFTKSDNTMRVFNDSDLRWAELDSALTFPPSSVRQASNYGFMAGAQMPSVAPAWDHIQKFSLTSDADATDVGNVTDRIRNGAGASSSTHGYLQGGFIGHGPNSPARINVIQKYSHTVDGDATDVADLLSVTDQGGGGFSPTHGYQFGGYTPATTDTIQKFDFASDGNATDVGNLLAPDRNNTASAISSTHIYQLGGYPSTHPSGDYVNIIQKFSMATDGDATDAGDLTQGVAYNGGSQSTTSGYRHGGNGWVPAPGVRNEIDKFPFAADGNATDVGDLTVARYTSGNGVSSTTHGYAMGGYAGTPTYSNVIDKYSHSSDGNATDVGNTLNPGYGGGLVGYGSSQN